MYVLGEQQGARVELGDEECELGQRPTWAIPVSSAREHPVCEYHWALGEDNRLWPGKEVPAGHVEEWEPRGGMEKGWDVPPVAARDLSSQPHSQV